MKKDKQLKKKKKIILIISVLIVIILGAYLIIQYGRFSFSPQSDAGPLCNPNTQYISVWLDNPYEPCDDGSGDWCKDVKREDCPSNYQVGNSYPKTLNLYGFSIPATFSVSGVTSNPNYGTPTTLVYYCDGEYRISQSEFDNFINQLCMSNDLLRNKCLEIAQNNCKLRVASNNYICVAENPTPDLNSCGISTLPGDYSVTYVCSYNCKLGRGTTVISADQSRD